MAVNIKQLSTQALDFIYKSGAMGIFKKDTKDKVFEQFINCDLQHLLKTSSRVEYDQKYDQIVDGLHRSVYPFYKENLKITIDNPYSYSSRLLNQFVKLIFSNSYKYKSIEQGIGLLKVIHPIISNQFIENYLPDIKSISDVADSEMYYDIVGYYSYLIDAELNEENQQLLSMLQGITV